MDIIINHPLSHDDATDLIRKIANRDSATRVFSTHALERMDERGFHHDWVDNVLKNGDVISHRLIQGSYRYKVRYTDQYGWSDVVTVIPNENRLVIITVIRED